MEAPVLIWMGETTFSDLSVWMPAAEMTPVYDRLLDMPADTQA